MAIATTIADNEPVPTVFAENFVSVDESDATSADFQAPKKENRWCLVELPADQIAALEAGQTFHIKEHSMGHSGNAALCTTNKTWGLEFLENSNPMFLANVTEAVKAPAAEVENKDPNSMAEGAEKTPLTPAKLCTIFGQCRGHILLKPLSADIQHVRDLLVPHSIDGETQEAAQGATASDNEPMTTSRLQFEVAASPKELEAILEQGPYVERDGAWFFMPATFEREVTDISLSLISLQSWDKTNLDVDALLKAVQEHFGEDGARYVPSTAVLLNALRGISREPAAPPAAEAPAAEKAAGEAAAPAAEAAVVQPVLEDGKVALDPEKIKLFQATQLLREPVSRLRDRFDLPDPASRAKRPKLAGGAGAAGGGQSLQIEDFCAAFSALTGSETTVEELCTIVGDRMYIDEMDGAVHTLDLTTLPQDARERLKRLFELSSHWKPDRIASLMLPTMRGTKVDNWLQRYTRTAYVEMEKGKEIRMLTRKFAGVN